jgi:hypothetical protein
MSKEKESSTEPKKDTYDQKKEKGTLQFLYSDGTVAATVDKDLGPLEQAVQVLTALFSTLPDKYIASALRDTLSIPSAADYASRMSSIRGIIKNTVSLVGMDKMLQAVRENFPTAWQTLQEHPMEISSGKEIIVMNSSELFNYVIKAEVEISLKGEGKTTYLIKGPGAVEFSTKATNLKDRKFSVEENDVVVDSNIRIALIRQKKLQPYATISSSSQLEVPP